MTADAQLPDWARAALDRVGEPHDEAALLGLVRVALSRLEALLPGRAPDRFAGLIAFCGAALASPLKSYPDALRKVLDVRGVAEAQTFEQTGDIAALRRGVDDLSAAAGDGAQGADAGASASLAHALFRLGEQSGDLAMLRASIDQFDALPPERVADPLAQSTRAVAAMTIGGVTGDRQMVERAILDLQTLIKRPGIGIAARAVVEQNLVVSLLRNAEQCRSARVYSEVLEHLAGRLHDRRRTPETEMLRLVQAMARFQFAKLAGDDRALRRTELELARLLRVFAQEPRRRLELLHLLGQARFQRARSKQSIGLTESAIACLRQAFDLFADGDGPADARRDRLLADLGYYVLQLGLWSNSVARVQEAQQLFEKALRHITMERAPGLYIQVAKGLFELHYRQQAFAAAAGVATDIDRAARLARADPRLTAGVLAQAPLDIVGIPERHALCLVRLGQLTQASAVLENARGQVLAAALERSSVLGAQVPSEVRSALADARVNLTVRLQSANDVAVRRAWEDYLTLRRRHGLDLRAAPRDAQRIAAASPPDGALVQLSLTPAGSYALVWTQQLREPMLATLPPNAWQVISGLLHGTSEGPGWITAYQRFVDDSARSDALARQAALDWADVIVNCLKSLWTVIFQPVEAMLRALERRPHAPLVICPQGELALLPLSAAMTPTGDVLSDLWDVSIAPNALAAARQQVDTADSRLVCLHSPAGDAAHELPLTAEEAGALRRLAPQMIEVSGAGLNAAGALAAMKQATHLHVACHGEYDANDPSRSGLVLAHGERLTLTRLWAAGFERFPVRMVFLSCCEGGMTGRSLDSDEFAGLPAAFLQLGARVVVAAQWAVHDDAARVFADGFYRRYLDAAGALRTSPARALGETRRWMRTVTVATLLEENYLTLAQAEDLFVAAALPPHRLRRYADDGPTTPQGGRSPGPDPTGLDAQVRPYAHACHWAGWTLFGQ